MAKRTDPLSIVFDEKSHQYSVLNDGVEETAFSVTQIIKLFYDMYRGSEGFSHHLTAAADRGRRIHERTVNLEMNREVCVNSWEKSFLEQANKIRNNGYQIESIEEAKVRKFGSVYVAGTPDRIYKNSRGGYMVADIKTTHTISDSYNWLQLAGYEWLFNLDTKSNNKYIIIHIKDTTTLKAADLETIKKAQKVWISLLEMLTWLVEHNPKYIQEVLYAKQNTIRIEELD